MRKIKLLFAGPCKIIVLDAEGSLVPFVRSLNIQTPPGEVPSVSMVRAEYGPMGEPDMRFIKEECQLLGVEVIVPSRTDNTLEWVPCELEEK